MLQEAARAALHEVSLTTFVLLYARLLTHLVFDNIFG